MSCDVLCVPTVKHSGTFLLQHILSDFEVIGFAVNELAEKTAFFGHTVNMYFDAIEDKMKRYPSIIPLRNPARVMLSWRGRRYGNPRVFREQWGCLDCLVNGKDVSYIHIDEPGLRDIELEKINEKLGLQLKTEWPVINSVANTINADIAGIEVDGWIKEFYESTYKQ